MKFPKTVIATSKTKGQFGIAKSNPVLVFGKRAYDNFLKEYPESDWQIEIREPTDAELKEANDFFSKPIFKPGKILRAVETTPHKEFFIKRKFLTTAAKYAELTKYKQYPKTIERLPYHWYSLNALIEVPMYYLLRFLNSERNPIIEVKNKSIIIVKLIVYLAGAIVSFCPLASLMLN